jgi:glycosyltransferase involved in cell wall biosynthesis
MVTTIPETLRAFLVPYACYFRGLGWRVDAMARDITKFDELAIHFDKLIDAGLSRNPLDGGNMKAARMIREAVSEGGYDIVHVHTPVAAFVTRFALRKHGKTKKPAVVYTAHGFHFYKGGGRTRNFIFRNIERMAGRWTDRMIVINHEDYDAAKKYRIVPEDSLVYMPGIGLDFSRYDPDDATREEARRVRDELGLKRDDVLFSMIAEFNPGKRHADVINALTRLPGSMNIHIAFAGEGPTREKIHELAKTLGVSKRAHFLGYVKHVPPLMLASRAMLIPSEREGLSRTAMESACMGVPIIGSDARGVRDIVQHSRGLLYPTGDIFALRDAMQQMYEEPHPPVTPDPEWRIEHLISLHQKMYEELPQTAAPK